MFMSNKQPAVKVKTLQDFVQKDAARCLKKDKAKSVKFRIPPVHSLIRGELITELWIYRN